MIRASTLTRSIPASDTRTQASITMPLSSTWSRTSITLALAGVRFTIDGSECEATAKTGDEQLDKTDSAWVGAAIRVLVRRGGLGIAGRPGSRRFAGDPSKSLTPKRLRPYTDPT